MGRIGSLFTARFDISFFAQIGYDLLNNPLMPMFLQPSAKVAQA
jgi:hypothetical protein